MPTPRRYLFRPFPPLLHLPLLLLLLLPLSLGVPPAAAAPVVTTGAAVIADTGFQELKGKRMGLITNHTARVGDRHLIDLLHEGGAGLVALFAPEHGLRGLAEDGVKIAGGVDEATGIMVHSLYGAVKGPDAAMLQGIDLLVFDIQDIGARFYTYISTMGLAMQAAAAAGIPFMILDRPNPLGGSYFGGPVLEPAHASFTGAYPIPVAHGLTVAELGLMIKGEKMLPGLEKLDLRVVKMEGWKRSMQWPDTGIAWIATSPNIPDFTTALLYPGIGFLEATAASEGRGTLEPFKLVGMPGIDSGLLAERLNREALPGVGFESARYTPRSIPGMSSSPKYRDREVTGLRLKITDRHQFRPVETAVHLLAAMHSMLPPDRRAGFLRARGFDELSGSGRFREALEAGMTSAEIVGSWQEELALFGEQRNAYLLY